MSEYGVLPTDYEFSFKSPFTMILAGPTSCGKTEFVKTLIKKRNEKISPPPSNTVWFYSIPQKWFSNFPDIEFIQGFDTQKVEDLLRITDIGSPSKLVVFDDLMQSVADSKLGSALFFEGSHHRNFSIILIVQNLYYKNLRTISINTQYFVLFKNPRDNLVCRKLAIQCNPKKAKAIDAIYNDATKKPFSYLVVDLKPTTNDKYRFLTNVLEEESPFVYIYLVR